MFIVEIKSFRKLKHHLTLCIPKNSLSSFKDMHGDFLAEVKEIEKQAGRGIKIKNLSSAALLFFQVTLTK
jgi:hypothetical protein